MVSAAAAAVVAVAVYHTCGKMLLYYHVLCIGCLPCTAHGLNNSSAAQLLPPPMHQQTPSTRHIHRAEISSSRRDGTQLPIMQLDAHGYSSRGYGGSSAFPAWCPAHVHAHTHLPYTHTHLVIEALISPSSSSTKAIMAVYMSEPKSSTSCCCCWPGAFWLFPFPGGVPLPLPVGGGVGG